MGSGSDEGRAPGIWMATLPMCPDMVGRETEIERQRSSSPCRDANPIGLGPTLMASCNINCLSKAQLQNQSCWGLGLWHVNFAGIQSSPEHMLWVGGKGDSEMVKRGLWVNSKGPELKRTGGKPSHGTDSQPCFEKAKVSPGPNGRAGCFQVAHENYLLCKQRA